MTRTIDLAVIGAGPAGAALAWEAATAGAHVVLVDDGRRPWQPIGQQLAPSTRTTLHRMGITLPTTAPTSATVVSAHPLHETRSAWDDPATIDTASTLFNPYGPPLAVDRAHLDDLLRTAARTAGARFITTRARPVPASPPATTGWRIPGITGTSIPVLVDATGTARTVSRTHLPRHTADRLRCTVWHTPAADHPQPFTLVEATQDGWWYTAPHPTTPTHLTLIHVQQAPGHTSHTPPPHTTRRLHHPVLPKPATERIAVVGCTIPAHTTDLLAVGDAALAVDPLSSSGLRHALEHARPAARAALGLIDHRPQPAIHYTHLIHTAFTRHLTERRHHYRAATAYAHHPFWRARGHHPTNLPTPPPPPTAHSDQPPAARQPR
ncbi:NAD(P)/FAD-dependent oxidoreductase [Streptomyces chartreusis]|uniref:NAD(P)/FAD-dependent oxidoreductase n=1 Tax=Streptomyces chartreusis TaxID=1969 RepID=UPI002E19C4BD|nr:tryptophan 7-halogenase [Streptomyces chartreusis]